MKLKSMAKKTVAMFLTLCIAMSIVTVGIPSAFAADNADKTKEPSTVASNTTTYISELNAINSSSRDYAKELIEKDGFTFIDHNTMVGTDRCVYVGYKTDINPENAITGLLFSEKFEKEIKYKGRTYLPVLHKSPFGYDSYGTPPFRSDCDDVETLYLYYTKETSESETTEYLTAVDVAESTSYTLRGKDYQSVVCAETNCPQNLNDPDEKQPTFLIYQAQMSPDDVYQKEGTEELSKAVKSVNGINYYNFDADVNKDDFLKRAITSEYNNNSVIKSWSKLLYSMLSIKEEGAGYRSRVGDFDTAYGKGKYLDIVAALSNGDGMNNADVDRGLILQTTGVQTTGRLSDVKDKMLEMLNSFNINNWWTLGSVDINGHLVKQDLFENVTSSSDVVYSLCMAVDDKASSGHDKSATVMGLAFYNFKLVPLVQDGSNTSEDLLNYDEVYTQDGESKNTVKIDKNNTSTGVSAGASFANSTEMQTTNSHSETNGQTYSVTEGISFGGTIPKIKVNLEASLELSQAFDFSETDTVTDSITTTETNTSEVSYTIPPYSIAVLNGSFSEETRTQNYDCPVALTYDVAFVSSGAELGSPDGVFYDDVAYKTDFYATFGNGTTNAVDVLKKINNSNGSKIDNSEFTVKATQQVEFSEYTSQEWSNILNKNILSNEYPENITDTIDFITGYQPASFLGGVFTSQVTANKYNFDKFYSLYKIDKIKCYKSKPAVSEPVLVQHIELNEGEKNYYLWDYVSHIDACTQFNTDWTGWDATQGYWALVNTDDKGNEISVTKITEKPISDGNIRVYKDPITSAIIINPISNGSSHVRYVINENVHQYYDATSDTSTDFNSGNLTYVTDNDVTSKGAILINTSNVKHAYDENGFCTGCGQFQPAELNADGIYEISNTGQLCWFSALVSGDNTYADFDEQQTDANGILLKDIDMSKRKEMIGTNSSRYSGTFDGAGHTVKLNYKLEDVADNHPAALFMFTSGATVKNLNTTGTITTKFKYASGIVGINYNNPLNISKCSSSVNIISNVNGDGTHGGILGMSDGKGDLIENCYFSGSITGEKTNKCAGIAGWINDSRTKIKNCYTSASYSLMDNNGNNIARGYASVENCYYLNSIAGTDGTKMTAEQFKSGKVTYLLNNGLTDGTQVWYQNIDNEETPDDFPKFTGGTVYQNPNDTYSNTEKKATEFDRDENNNLMIESYEDLVKLAELIRSDYDIYGSESYILTCNIFAIADSVWSTGIGSVEENKPFNGTFHGDGHVISGLNISAENYGGLFEIIAENGTVDNLAVIDFDYLDSSCQYAGGIAAINDGTIYKCVSGLNLTSGRIFKNPQIQESIAAKDLNSNIRGNIAGGIAAVNNGTISATRNSSIVVAVENTGGIAGINNGRIHDCANNAAIGNTSSKVSGGLAGTNTGEIKSSYNSGKIQSKTSGSLGAVVGINTSNGETTPTVKNVFYAVINGVNAVGKASTVSLDSSNIKKPSISSMQTEDFTNELNDCKTNDIEWKRYDSTNMGFPIIQSDFLKMNEIKSENGIIVRGFMHEDLQIEYTLCDRANICHQPLYDYANGTNFDVYKATITDKNGVEIPYELWCRGPLEISIPSDVDIQVAGLTSKNEVVEYESKTSNGYTTFTASEPIEFIVTSEKTLQSDVSNPVDKDDATIDNGVVNTGQLSNSIIYTVMILFGAALLLIFIQRSKRREQN